MPLTETSKKEFFGTAEPKKLRDWSGPCGQLLYEGYAVHIASETEPAWVIYKHFFDVNNKDTGDKHIFGGVWSLRTIYTYD